MRPNHTDSMTVRALLGSLLIAAGLVPLQHAQERADVLRVFVKHEHDPRQRADLVEQLSRLKPDPVPVLYDLYGRGVEALFDAEADGEIELSKYWCPPDEFSELALEALATSQPKTVVKHLALRLAQAPAVGERLSLMRILGHLGDHSGLELLVNTLNSFSRDQLASITIQFSFETALAQILQNDPAAGPRLRKLADQVPLERMSMLVRAALGSDHPRALEFLMTQFGRSDELDAQLLHALATLHERYPWASDKRMENLVLAKLSSADPALQSRAIWTAGRMRIIDSAPRLLTLLGSTDRRIQSASLEALVLLSGERLRSANAPWAAWIAEENRWWKEEAPELIARLWDKVKGGDAGLEYSDALRKLARHPLFAQPIAAELAELLPSAPAELALECLRLLQVLDSRIALPALIPLLDADEEAIREAAHATLLRLTEADLGREADAWARLAKNS